MALRLGGALKELRIHLCQTSASSEGVRKFIQNQYVKIKSQNPEFPILIRECQGINPVVWARFDKGVEKNVNLTNLKETDVLNSIQQLVK